MKAWLSFALRRGRPYNHTSTPPTTAARRPARFRRNRGTRDLASALLMATTVLFVASCATPMTAVPTETPAAAQPTAAPTQAPLGAGVGVASPTAPAAPLPSDSPTPSAPLTTPTTTPATAASATTPVASAATAASTGAVPVNPQVDVSATTKILNPGVVSWVHFGDLHITTADQQNYKDLQTIIAHTNQYLKNGINFAVLPGDNANDGTASEYQLIKQAVDQLQVPLYAVPGDHDHKSGLSLYNQYLEPKDYYSFSAGGYHFAFLDVMAGISADEKTWVQNDLGTAAKAGLKNVIFMHSFSAASQLQDVIQQDHVIMVDSGHTHYNDVANDGHTIYAAGRNTGQVTEGPVGFTMVTLDNGVVSWKFKPLGSWPFVMITSPTDKQLMIDGAQVVHGTTNIRAKVWDDKGVASVTMRVDGGTPVPMERIGDTQMWSTSFDSTRVADGDHQVRVDVQGAGGNIAEDTITVAVNQSGSAQLAQRSFGPSGNDIGAYAEKGLLGSHTAGGPGGKAGGPAGKTAGPRGKGGPGGPGGPGGSATILGVAGNVLTVRLGDGTTEKVQVTNSTQITRVMTGAPTDLKVGEVIDLHTQGGGARSPVGTSPAGAATPVPSSGAVTATQITIHPAPAT